MEPNEDEEDESTSSSNQSSVPPPSNIPIVSSGLAGLAAYGSDASDSD